MMNQVVIRRDDGGVSIACIRAGATEAEIWEVIRKWEEACPEYQCVGFYLTTPEVILAQDRSFRNAWTHSLSVDMDKARGIHMDRIREVRNKELEKLDIAYRLAQERGDAVKMAQIAAQAQELRDIPQTFDLSQATDIQSLKALWPAKLPGGFENA